VTRSIRHCNTDISVKCLSVAFQVYINWLSHTLINNLYLNSVVTSTFTR
jgi:hypothetical protein